MIARPKKPRAAAAGAAEEIAGKALLFLAEEPRRLERFLGETGIGPDDLMSSVGAPETLAAVLDHLLRDESQLLVFAAGAGVKPEDVVRAHAALSGGPAEGGA